MSKAILLNTGWTFTKEGHDEPVTLPPTWNAIDGQDGGNDYYRGTCSYTRNLEKPELSDGDRAVLQFDGVAMTAVVSLNGEKVAEHKGGYSTFRVEKLRFMLKLSKHNFSLPVLTLLNVLLLQMMLRLNQALTISAIP